MKLISSVHSISVGSTYAQTANELILGATGQKMVYEVCCTPVDSCCLLTLPLADRDEAILA